MKCPPSDYPRQRSPSAWWRFSDLFGRPFGSPAFICFQGFPAWDSSVCVSSLGSCCLSLYWAPNTVILNAYVRGHTKPNVPSNYGWAKCVVPGSEGWGHANVQKSATRHTGHTKETAASHHITMQVPRHHTTPSNFAHCWGQSLQRSSCFSLSFDLLCRWTSGVYQVLSFYLDLAGEIGKLRHCARKMHATEPWGLCMGTCSWSWPSSLDAQFQSPVSFERVGFSCQFAGSAMTQPHFKQELEWATLVIGSQIHYSWYLEHG